MRENFPAGGPTSTVHTSGATPPSTAATLRTVNLVLFERAEIDAPLPRSDPRAVHVLDVLRRNVGDTFDAGMVDGPLGKATLVAATPEALKFHFVWGPSPPPSDPIVLIIGLPRPQTARDILRDATTLGVAALHFVATERSDINYAASTLWTSGEWRRHCLAGAAQAFATRLPNVTSGQSLAAALASLPPTTLSPTPATATAAATAPITNTAITTARLALDNYEASTALSESNLLGYFGAVVLALGPERGWGPADRATLRAEGFTLVHLGARVLRSETAVVGALTLVRAKLGLLHGTS